MRMPSLCVLEQQMWNQQPDERTVRRIREWNVHPIPTPGIAFTAPLSFILL